MTDPLLWVRVERVIGPLKTKPRLSIVVASVNSWVLIIGSPQPPVAPRFHPPLNNNIFTDCGSTGGSSGYHLGDGITIIDVSDRINKIETTTRAPPRMPSINIQLQHQQLTATIERAKTTTSPVFCIRNISCTFLFSIRVLL